MRRGSGRVPLARAVGIPGALTGFKSRAGLSRRRGGTSTAAADYMLAERKGSVGISKGHEKWEFRREGCVSDMCPNPVGLMLIRGVVSADSGVCWTVSARVPREATASRSRAARRASGERPRLGLVRAVRSVGGR